MRAFIFCRYFQSEYEGIYLLQVLQSESEGIYLQKVLAEGNNSIFLRRSFFPQKMPLGCPHLTTVQQIQYIVRLEEEKESPSSLTKKHGAPQWFNQQLYSLPVVPILCTYIAVRTGVGACSSIVHSSALVHSIGVSCFKNIILKVFFINAMVIIK